MKLKIQGTKFSRDLNNMAVLCNDRSEVTRYESEMRKYRENQIRDEEINKLKNEISEIKEMLQILIRGQNG
jgi:predicted RNase H-like nuclease (RuvC/YqgF family)